MESKFENPSEAKAHLGASSGCCAHEQFEMPTDVLSAEHRVIERVLAVIEKLSQAPLEKSVESWKKAFEFIRHFADGCHHLKEEKILFPALEEHGIPRDGGPLGIMLLEHEEGRAYVKAMKAALTLAETNNAAAKDALVTSAQAYVRLLREHIEKEDQILFRIAADVLPESEQKSILRRFEEHEAKEMGAGAHEKYLKIVQQLEASVA